MPLSVRQVGVVASRAHGSERLVREASSDADGRSSDSVESFPKQSLSGAKDLNASGPSLRDRMSGLVACVEILRIRSG